ncbi:hypothetical protein IKQ21_05465 [bacterium]|nr:hypothetical protein [bacterium]
MKKICTFLILLSLVSVLTAGCATNSNKPNMIQSKRRFAEYVEPQGNVNKDVIDLSEGPKQNYNAQLGPQNLNFDIKIVDPY